MTTRVVELFGRSTAQGGGAASWREVVRRQQCPFLERKCLKVRKSRPDIAIGTCSVAHGADRKAVVICPQRLLHGRKIFVDCLHLLVNHEPGNELHLVSELSIPGGSVDYFLASARRGRVRDFVGVELQTLDSTGTVWPERQRFLHGQGVEVPARDLKNDKPFGINWKMTAKTTLVQIHHKIETFEHLGKRLALVIQSDFLDYMRNEFRLDGFTNPARVGDPLHVHAYRLVSAAREETGLTLDLAERISADSSAVASALGLKANARIDLDEIVAALEARLSRATRFVPV